MITSLQELVKAHENSVLQSKMIIKFRESHIAYLEKKLRGHTADSELESLRREIRALQSMQIDQRSPELLQLVVLNAELKGNSPYSFNTHHAAQLEQHDHEKIAKTNEYIAQQEERLKFYIAENLDLRQQLQMAELQPKRSTMILLH